MSVASSNSCPNFSGTLGLRRHLRDRVNSLDESRLPKELDLKGISRLECGFKLPDDFVRSPSLGETSKKLRDTEAKDEAAMADCYIFLDKYDNSNRENKKNCANEYCKNLLNFISQPRLPAYLITECKDKLSDLMTHCIGHLTLENIKLVYILYKNKNT